MTIKSEIRTKIGDPLFERAVVHLAGHAALEATRPPMLYRGPDRPPWDLICIDEEPRQPRPLSLGRLECGIYGQAPMGLQERILIRLAGPLAEYVWFNTDDLTPDLLGKMTWQSVGFLIGVSRGGDDLLEAYELASKLRHDIHDFPRFAAECLTELRKQHALVEDIVGAFTDAFIETGEPELAWSELLSWQRKRSRLEVEVDWYR